MFGVFLKILDSFTGQPWGISPQTLEGYLEDPKSEINKKLVIPYLTEKDPGFKPFFCFEETSERGALFMQQLLKKERVNLEEKGKSKPITFTFVEEAYAKILAKLEEVEKDLINIDPALLGLQRAEDKILPIRLLYKVCYIFKRIFVSFTSHKKIQTLFFARNALNLRNFSLIRTFPELHETSNVPEEIFPKIREIVKQHFKNEQEEGIINYILENALPQDHLNEFMYDPRRKNFVIKYDFMHEYKDEKDLSNIKIGKIDFTVICEKEVQGQINPEMKTISFKKGIKLSQASLSNKSALSFKAKMIETIAKSKMPPALEAIQVLDSSQIKVKFRLDLSILSTFFSFLKKQEDLTAPVLSYDTIKSYLSKVKWTGQF